MSLQPGLWDDARTALEPVELLLERDHAYRKRPPREDPVTGEAIQPPGCSECGRAKLARAHLGAPPTLNAGGSGMNRHAYQSLKGAWQAALAELLDASGLPRGLSRVQVEAQVGLPTRQKCDEGNLRWMVEKALGDALVAGGWLEDDCFYPVARYSFGALTGVHAPGRSYTRLFLFPTGGDADTVGGAK